jgi:hypothetical protein
MAFEIFKGIAVNVGNLNGDVPLRLRGKSTKIYPNLKSIGKGIAVNTGLTHTTQTIPD